jgi:hypothetical protein
MEIRKKAVSIRISSSDVSKIKRLAKRLGVRDSDVIRFAVKSALAKLAPLQDPEVRGRNLVPVFVESGSELFHHFDLDAMRLENIINDDADDERRVDHEDIQLIAMSGVQQPYLRWRLATTPAGNNGVHGPGGSSGNGNGTSVPDARHEQASDPGHSLREYLYEKYVYRNPTEA